LISSIGPIPAVAPPPVSVTKAPGNAVRDPQQVELHRTHPPRTRRRDSRPEITTEIYYGLMVGLSAAITAGTDWRVAADVLRTGLRRAPPNDL
jgi:hypothetical protein